MNKAQIINLVAKKTNVSIADTTKIINELQEAIVDAVVNNDDVIFTGFGTFTSQFREARTGRNPATNVKLEIAATTAPKFKPGKKFKDAVADSHIRNAK